MAINNFQLEIKGNIPKQQGSRPQPEKLDKKDKKKH